jgi:hypothetical protein
LPPVRVELFLHGIDAAGLKLNFYYLIERSVAIKDQLEDVGEVNMKSVSTMQELSDGDDIKEAIALAHSMDDLVMACTGKIVSMVDRVTEGFKNLPDILTAGINVVEKGKQENDPKLRIWRMLLPK